MEGGGAWDNSRLSSVPPEPRRSYLSYLVWKAGKLAEGAPGERPHVRSPLSGRAATRYPAWQDSWPTSMLWPRLQEGGQKPASTQCVCKEPEGTLWRDWKVNLVPKVVGVGAGGSGQTGGGGISKWA